MPQVDTACVAHMFRGRPPVETFLFAIALAVGLSPELLPAILTGLLYCFVRAMTAVSQVIFLVSPGHDLVTVLLLSWAEYGHLGRGAALASLLVLFLAAVILPVERLGRRLRLRVVGGGS